MLNVGVVVSKLMRMTPAELREEYGRVFGETARSGNKQWLLRRIAWRVQADAEGGLPERARQRAMELANDADLRTRGPGRGDVPAGTIGPATGRVVVKNFEVPADARLPMPGALLTRKYKGRTIRVRVMPKGFDYEGMVYRSLSAVAHAVTGAKWNGYLFFGIQAAKGVSDGS